MKSGLNFKDVNALKEALRYGDNLDKFAADIYCSREVIDKYIASMDPEEVEALRSSAPATGVDIESIKEELKAELREELYEDMTAPSGLDDYESDEDELKEALAEE